MVEQFLVNVENLTCTHHDGTVALNDLSFTVQENRSLAVVGPNGAGKSSLLTCLMGFLQYSGTIQIESIPLSPTTLPQIRRIMTLVFQDPDDQLFMPTLAEDIAFGPRNLNLGEAEIERRIDTVLHQLNLADLKDRPPHHLSFGEKRRAALATALAMNPRILLLDEPTANLDPATRRELLAYLAELDATLIIATHDLRFIQSLCPDILLLSEGHKIIQTATSDLLRDNDLLRLHRLE